MSFSLKEFKTPFSEYFDAWELICTFLLNPKSVHYTWIITPGILILQITTREANKLIKVLTFCPNSNHAIISPLTIFKIWVIQNFIFIALFTYTVLCIYILYNIDLKYLHVLTSEVRILKSTPPGFVI